LAFILSGRIEADHALRQFAGHLAPALPGNWRPF
jgi:hypothetical protein